MKLNLKNKLSIKARIIVTVVVFILIFICFCAMTMPPKQLKIERQIAYADDIIETISADKINQFNNCQLEPNGKISITGTDANIVFSGYNREIQTVKLNFNKPVESDFNACLYYDAEQGFSEDRLEEYMYCQAIQVFVLRFPKQQTVI